MPDAVIVSTARTPIGKAYRGAFNMTHGAELGGHVVKQAVARAGVDPAEVEDVILGCALPERATGGNIARQAAIRAGLPVSVAGMTVNRFCSSGLQTIALAAQRIIAGEASVLGNEPTATGRGYRVLVVEDNDQVGQFSTELLEDLGYSVKRVANANAALAILAEDEFATDLVFSDVIMPGMNGLELAGIIRERFPGLPVVLTSGYSDVLAANAHHGFELIQKPYSVESLSRILRKAISEKGSAVR